MSLYPDRGDRGEKRGETKGERKEEERKSNVTFNHPNFSLGEST
jgi:hypothetical protein